jgi:transaldolase
MKIKIFLDGANLQEILEYKDSDVISGFTTNPSLMRKAGVGDYMEFAENLASDIPVEKDVSLEVIADELPEMERQAIKISEVSQNFYAKIPITNTKGEFTGPIIKCYCYNDGKTS